MNISLKYFKNFLLLSNLVIFAPSKLSRSSDPWINWVILIINRQEFKKCRQVIILLTLMKGFCNIFWSWMYWHFWLYLYYQISDNDSTFYCGNVKNISNLCGFHCTGKEEIILEQREVAFLSPSKICEIWISVEKFKFSQILLCDKSVTSLSSKNISTLTLMKIVRYTMTNWWCHRRKHPGSKVVKLV